MNNQKWPKEQAQAWYEQRPWLVGCNFIPSTAINQIEMWQRQTFDPDTIERELGWAAGLGFNTMRVFLHDLVWQADAAVFKHERVGCYNWGLVKGKTQTIYPWDSKIGAPEPDIWFHDILREDGTPFSEKEVKFIKDIAAAR